MHQRVMVTVIARDEFNFNMARMIGVTSPSEKTDAILQELKGVSGLFDLQVFRKASVEPPGDVIKFSVPNSHLNEIMRLMVGHQLRRKNGISLSSSEPDSYIPVSSAYGIERDINEGSWEEMEMTISNDSNTSINTLLIIGAALTAVLLQSMGSEPVSGSSSYYVTEKKLINYWTTVTMTSLLASAAASIAGALLIATKKSVFASGVMIGLALVPTAAIIGMGVVARDFAASAKSLLRFALDVGLVFIFSTVVFLWIRLYYHKRDIRLS